MTTKLLLGTSLLFTIMLLPFVITIDHSSIVNSATVAMWICSFISQLAIVVKWENNLAHTKELFLSKAVEFEEALQKLIDNQIKSK